MVFVMMKQTTSNVIMMEETVVDHASIKATAQIALVLEILMIMEFLML